MFMLSQVAVAQTVTVVAAEPTITVPPELSSSGDRTDVSAYRLLQELADDPRSRVLSPAGLRARLTATVPDRLDSCWLAEPPARAVLPTTLQRLFVASY